MCVQVSIKVCLSENVQVSSFITCGSDVIVPSVLHFQGILLEHVVQR